MLTSALALLFGTALAPTLGAQAATVSAAMDRQVSRARALLDNGEGTDARNVLDSLVAVAPPASFDLAEALYWRAVLAEHIADAERDWKRLVIESPLSPRTPDALVRLGELELLRAHPKEARAWFERVVREFPTGAPSTKSALLIARSWFDEQNVAQGCTALDEARAMNIPEGEQRLQAEEMGRRCGGAASGSGSTAAGQKPGEGARGASGAGKVTPAPPVPAPATAVTPAPSTAPLPAPAATTSAGRFSVQLAAYNTRAEADEAVTRLIRRGLDVRVDGDVKPFRVRSGRYATRAQAAAALAALKKQGLGGFIAELAP